MAQPAEANLQADGLQRTTRHAVTSLSLVCVLSGLLQECAGAKGAAWTRARSVLATQHSRSTRQHRVSWDPRVKGSSNDQVCKPASALAQNSALRHGWS